MRKHTGLRTMNPWYNEAIARAIDGADTPHREASLVAAEYDRMDRGSLPCPCGGLAWMKASIGANKCVECGKLTHNGSEWF